MKITGWTILSLAVGVLSLAACSTSITGWFANPTPLPPTAAPTPVYTLTPTPNPTPVILLPPAADYLPNAAQIPTYYETESNVLSDNLLSNAPLPVPVENLAVVSYRNKGFQSLDLPQGGVYSRFVYWVILAGSDTEASLYYNLANSQEYIQQAFLVIMPAAVQEDMEQPNVVNPEFAACDESSLLTVANHQILPPDLYLYSVCRVKNALVIFWGHTVDNYDGKNSPIPEAEILKQVGGFLDRVTVKMQP